MVENSAGSRKPSVSCVFVCHDGDGRILLARRGRGARDEPGTWDCGAGALEFGETFEQAVTREVSEEYTTTPLDITLLGVRNVLRGDAQQAEAQQAEAQQADAEQGDAQQSDAQQSELQRGDAQPDALYGGALADDPPSHWVAIVFAVLVDPATVAIGEPHKFDQLGWFAPDALPAPLHSQLPATLELATRDRKSATPGIRR
jgi:8-oxo-dGTP diphosphatase